VARAGTTAVSVVSETTVKLAGPNPLKVTSVVDVKFVPDTVTAVPGGPLVGVNEAIVGGGGGGGG